MLGPPRGHLLGASPRGGIMVMVMIMGGMLTSWAAAAGLLTPPAITTRRATAASLRLCATLDEGLEVIVFAMG